ncbi:unnamed protein product [Candida verbasci]|uniref:Nonsense-mediated mRNA decay protein 2 n=1 Tax=Candida verbasci TaxID=1227364 RepID=A0A9W4TTD6_9ASCO|nr:unnamed protein product [Candida verbasci]
MELDDRRKELYNLNTRAWDGESVFKTATKLDSSLKKNTTFIKKVKLINNEQYKTIIKDVETLSIEKYLSEVIVSIGEALVKVSKSDDTLASMEVVSALHQRFITNFTPYLLINLLLHISNTNEEKEKSARQKNLLKLIGEFYIIGIFRNLKDCNKEDVPDEILTKFGKFASEPIIIIVLKDLLNYQLKSGNSLSMAQAFLKRFHHMIYDPQNELLSFEVKNVLQQIFNIYTKAVFNHLMVLKKKVHQVSEINKKASIRTGKILEKNQTELENVTKLFEKFKSTSEYLSTTLEIPLPSELNQVEKEESKDDSKIEVVKTKTLNEDELNGVWEDVKERNFYTIISSLGELIDAYPEIAKSTSTKDGEKIQEFLAKLQNMSSNDLEQLVVEFNNLNLNNKATKNRIMKFFVETSNINNLKYYTKFLKINEMNLHDLILELITYLDKGFRSQLYQNKLNFKNIYFFIEMIKFKMIPTHLIFHKIRSLTINITSTNNIDILSVFYENVGRFLLSDLEYLPLMKEMISLLKEKSKLSNLNINDKLAINNLLIIVEPPATRIVQPRIELSSKSQFIQRLLRVELNNKSLPLVVNLLRKISFKTNEECFQTMLDCFAKPDLLKYDNIPALAQVLSIFSDKYKRMVVFTVDTIIENIIRSLELNDYRMNRSRMAQVKYIAEMYNSKIINFILINDLLYKILCFGHLNNQPLPNNWDIEIDLPNNYFRIQQVCLLLNSLNSIYVDTELSYKKKTSKPFDLKKRNDVNKNLLGVFMTFLQYYIYCKEQPLPIEINFKLNDVFVKYKSIPTVIRYDTIQEIVKRLSESTQTKKEAELYFDEEENEEEIEIENEDLNDHEEDVEIDIIDEEEDEDSTESESSESEEDEEEEAEELSDVQSETSEIIQEDMNRLDFDQKFNQDLDKELQRILNESYTSNTSFKSHQTNKLLPLPRQFINQQRPTVLKSNDQKISFSLITKDGKKSISKQFYVPKENQFAQSVIKEQEDAKQDKERIMKLVSKMQD